MMANEIYESLTHVLEETRSPIKDSNQALEHAADRFIKLYEWHRDVKNILLRGPVKPQAGVIKYIEVLDAILEGKT